MRREDPRKNMIQLARRRSKIHEVPFDLVYGDFVIPEKCPVLGVDLEVGKGKVQQNSPTLDRIIPEKGYVKGNIQVISMKANTMKSNGTLEELKLLVDWLEKQVN